MMTTTELIYAACALPLDLKIEVAQQLLLSIADDDFGPDSNPTLYRWLHRIAGELPERCE